jgi:hypothetical protein
MSVSVVVSWQLTSITMAALTEERTYHNQAGSDSEHSIAGKIRIALEIKGRDEFLESRGLGLEISFNPA